MFMPHRAYTHFIRTVRSLQSASNDIASSSSLIVRGFDCRYLLQRPSAIEPFTRTLSASFVTMAKIKVSIVIKNICQLQSKLQLINSMTSV